MKTTRNELKSIIKECLRELVQEGAFGGGNQQQFQQQQQFVNPAMINRAQNMAGGNQMMENVLTETLMNSEPDPGVSLMGTIQQQSATQQTRGGPNRWAELAFNTQPRVMPVFPT